MKKKDSSHGSKVQMETCHWNGQGHNKYMGGNNMAYRNALTRAVSGNFATDNTYIVYWIEIIQNSQNIVNNTTNVTVKVWCKRTNTGYTTTGNGTCYCTINGTQYSASITSSQSITSTPR